MSSSDTKICEGVISVRESGDKSDTEDTFSNNIKLAGGDLPDKRITDVFAADSKIAYDKLRERGLRPSINKNEFYDCITQLPAGRLIDLYLESTKNISLNLSDMNFNETIYEKASMCPDLFTENEMTDYLQDLINEFPSHAGEFLLSSLLKKYIHLINLYKQEYNFNWTCRRRKTLFVHIKCFCFSNI